MTERNKLLLCADTFTCIFANCPKFPETQASKSCQNKFLEVYLDVSGTDQLNTTRRMLCILALHFGYNYVLPATLRKWKQASSCVLKKLGRTLVAVKIVSKSLPGKVVTKNKLHISNRDRGCCILLKGVGQWKNIIF